MKRGGTFKGTVEGDRFVGRFFSDAYLAHAKGREGGVGGEKWGTVEGRVKIDPGDPTEL